MFCNRKVNIKKTQNGFIKCVMIIEPTNLFCKDVKGMAIMVVPVHTYVLPIVIKVLVTYMMEPVFHVNLDGQGNSVTQVYISFTHIPHRFY